MKDLPVGREASCWYFGPGSGRGSHGSLEFSVGQWESCRKADSGLAGVGQGPGVCVCSKLPTDTDASSPGTKLGVAGI